MASSQFIAFALVTIILPTLTMAAEHIVGDDKGWTVNFNYTTWASGKVFHVGDTLFTLIYTYLFIIYFLTTHTHTHLFSWFFKSLLAL
jgi:hypothetical protein